MKGGAGHTSVRQGKRVIVLLRSGEKLIDVFMGKKSSYIELRDAGKIDRNLIRTIGIYKGAA